MGTDLDVWMRQLAERQHGVVGRDQLRARGVRRQYVAARLASPDWEPLSPRVVRLAGTARSGRQRAMAAVLDAGAGSVLSHHSAAALWGLPGFALDDLHVTRPRSGTKRASSLATIHAPLTLPAAHGVLRDGIPVTTLARTVFDVAAVVSEMRAEAALHAALRLGLRLSCLEALVESTGGPGRPGTATTRALLERQRGKVPMGSGLEVRLLRLLQGAGLPEPRRQVDVGHDRWAGRVDFLYEDCRLAIEFNGAHWHTTALDVERDQRRTAELVAAGYRVLPLAEQAIRERPNEVARLVRAARAAAGASRTENDMESMSKPGRERRGGRYFPRVPAARSSAMAQPKAMR